MLTALGNTANFCGKSTSHRSIISVNVTLIIILLSLLNLINKFYFEYLY